MITIDLPLALETARRAAEAAGRAALAHFRRDVRVETKLDRTPVTIADREAEEAAASVIRGAFPTHGILGEESGATPGAVPARWIIDPIDGTRGFVRGGAHWGPIVALEYEGVILAGAIGLPARDEYYWAARGQGCFMREGDALPTRVSVSAVGEWREATLSLGEPHVLFAPPLHDPVLELIATSATSRCYGDVAGVTLVLSGRAEAWLEAGVQLWDIAAVPVLVEEAGGRVTDLAGGRTLSTACIASNGRVHDAILRVLAPSVTAR